MAKESVAVAQPQTLDQLKNVDLAARAIMVHLRIGTWAKSKKDKEITNEVVVSHGTDEKAGKWMKNLAGSRPPKAAMNAARAAFEKPYEIAREARAFHYYMTRAWLDDGKRMLDVDLLDDYVRKMDDLADQFERAVEELDVHWPVFVQDALSSLNSTGKPSDYPRQGEIKDAFMLAYMMSGVPTAQDFRAEVSEVQVERIKRQVEESMTVAIQSSMRQEIADAVEIVAKLAKGLRDYKPAEGEGDGRVRAQNAFHQSLVGNVEKLSKHLRHVNITDDPMWDQIADDIKVSLTNYDADTLKDSAQKREEIAAEADRITALLNPFIA